MYTREQFLELAERHKLAMTFDNEFKLTDEDMRIIEYALRFTADRCSSHIPNSDR